MILDYHYSDHWYLKCSYPASKFSCRYVNGINTILTSSIPVLGNLLSTIYFQFFLDKVKILNIHWTCFFFFSLNKSCLSVKTNFWIVLLSTLWELSILSFLPLLTYLLIATCVVLFDFFNSILIQKFMFSCVCNAKLQLASSLGPRFYLNIFKCKQISETGAQQVLIIFTSTIFLVLCFYLVLFIMLWFQGRDAWVVKF